MITQLAKIHIDKASEARKLYREDIIRPNCYSVDMQKVLIIPKLTTKEKRDHRQKQK